MSAAMRESAVTTRLGRRWLALGAVRSRAVSVLSGSLPWLIVLAGLGLRLGQYRHDRSLFLDEVSVATNIAHKGYMELVRTLQFDQCAPAGFLFAVKATCGLLGRSDCVLRLVSLVAGCSAMAMFFWFARRFAGRAPAMLATAFFALSSSQVYYASELKPYALDVLASMAMIAAFAELDGRRIGALGAAGLGLLGAVAVFFSFPVAIVMAGLGACAGVRELAARRWSQVGWLAVVAALWFAGFVGLYFLQLRHFDRNAGWIEFCWGKDFMPLTASASQQVKWALEKLREINSSGVGLVEGGLAAFAFLLGLGEMWRRSRYKFCVLISPLLATTALSALRTYPLGGRAILYLAPATLVFIALGVDSLRRTAPKGTYAAPCIAAIFLLVQPLHSMADACHGKLYINTMFYGYRFEESKPLMRYLREHWQPGDQVYLYNQSYISFEYYADQFGFQKGDWVRGMETGFMDSSWAHMQSDLQKLQGRKRVWVFFVHILVGDHGADERLLYLHFLDQIGRCQDRYEIFGDCAAAVYLYDLSPPESSPQADSTKKQVARQGAL
jgi:hypothetical protein